MEEEAAEKRREAEFQRFLGPSCFRASRSLQYYHFSKYYDYES